MMGLTGLFDLTRNPSSATYVCTAVSLFKNAHVIKDTKPGQSYIMGEMRF